MLRRQRYLAARFALITGLLLAAPAAAHGTPTTITTGPSEFGTMLWDGRGQAIYVFQRDLKGKSRCYGECARAWPPVYTTGKPQVAGDAVAGKLGTTKRRDGRRQVTYRGRPLYYYAHEAPGQVLCHDILLNGGKWWVIGPDGKRRPS
jgi:predicted lipoprotein with Yx(FWY)xxD motif